MSALTNYHRTLHELAADRSLGDGTRVRAAILADAAGNADRIDPGRVRAILTNQSGLLDVYGRAVGPAYTALRSAGLIRHDGWITSTDRRGGNAGKPAHACRFVDPGRPLTDDDLAITDRWALL